MTILLSLLGLTAYRKHKAKAAEIKGVTPQEILDVTCENARKFFRI